jgi:hypothetical protein
MKKDEAMKQIQRLAAASIAALIVITSVSANAAEPVRSHPAKALSELPRSVPGNTPDRIDRSIQPGTPKSRELALSVRKVPAAASSIDLAHGPSPLLPAKHPRFDIALRELRATTFEVAPLK